MVSASRQMTVYCFRQPRLPLQLPGCPSPPPTKASVLYGIGSSLLSKTENYRFWNVGKHGLIIEFIDPDYNVMRSATCLPEVAADEGWTKTGN